MLHRRNNDSAVPCERQEGLLGNWQATNSLIIVNGQPFGIGGKKGKLLLARSLGVKKALYSDDPFPLPDRSFTTHARAVQADRPGRAALASVTPPPEPGQPRQRRLADRHPSRDAAAEAAEVWDRTTLALAITCDPRGCRISRTVSATAWALAAGMARVAQAASSAVPPDDEAGRHGPVPELPAHSSDFWPRSAV